MIKKIAVGLLLVFIVIQFFRPQKNSSSTVSPNDIAQKYSVPANVHKILQTSCYDCHSNNTVYPWYSNVQPVAWFMADHVNEGKEELNFSEFGTYQSKKAAHKLEEIAGEVSHKGMPLSSYTIIHKDAVLSDDDINLIKNWATKLQDSILKKTDIN